MIPPRDPPTHSLDQSLCEPCSCYLLVLRVLVHKPDPESALWLRLSPGEGSVVVGGLTKLGLKCLDSISSLPVGEDWSARERGCQRARPPYLCAFLWSSWIAAGIFLVICVRRLPLLYCVHFGGLVYHLNKKLAD